jgi:protein-S-isoprenylcysteine O-methyltransferase Ste14
MDSTKKTIWRSLLFVFVQIITLGLIGATGPLFAENKFLLLIEMAGLFLGIWAVIIMKPGFFNITPDPLAWSKLVKVGPYRFIRHPMYLALLLTTFPLIIDRFNYLRLIFWVALLIDLLLKISYEEKILVAEVDGYEDYLKSSYRLVPMVY